MHQVEPIDDYIEPLIALKAHVASIEKHLMRSDFKAADDELVKAGSGPLVDLLNWCGKHCEPES